MKLMQKISILLIFLLFLFSLSLSSMAQTATDDKVVVYFFYSPTCPHCAKERPFLEEMEGKYPQLKVKYLEVGKNIDMLKKFAKEYNTTTAGVPRTFLPDKVFIGFSEDDSELIYHEGYKAYIGYKNQIEICIKKCLNITCSLPERNVIELSRENYLVKTLLEKNPNSLATIKLINDTYLVAWWTPERIKSNLQYPNALVKINSFTGEILSSEIPSAKIAGIEKPIQGLEWYYLLIPVAIMIYLILYLFLKNRVSLERRYWLIGFFFILIISGFLISITTSEEAIAKFASKFPFPVFVFIIALLDGLNPCAFAVLMILLSLLTYSRSRRSMLLVGSIFIITSGVMYFIFIMLILLAGSLIFSSYGILLFQVIGIVLIIAAIINLKDFFLFGKGGISLTISEKQKGKIMHKAGKIVREMRDAKTRTSLVIALAGVILLAIFVNLVELGCSVLLPMAYTAALFKNFGSEPIAPHYIYTAFYSLIYIIPLFAILGNFIYSFKSERLSEKQGRILKLIGGIMMLLLGLILIFKPELLTLG